MRHSRRRLSLAFAAGMTLVASVFVASRPAFSASDCTAGSGGKAVAHRAGGVAITDATIIAQAPSARLCHVGFDAAEPTIGATSNGDVFYFASPTNTDIDIMKTSDDGATWSDTSGVVAGPVKRHMLDLDPYLYVDRETNRVFMADLYVGCTEMSFSDDGGQSWTTNPAACGLPLDDHETIFAGKPVTSTTVGYPKVVYYCFQDFGGLGGRCSKSIDGGNTFIPPTASAFDGVQCSAIHAHGVAGPDGTIYLPKADYCGHPTLAISHDEGATWTDVIVSTMTGAPDHEAGVAVDPAGNLYFTWVAANRLPYLVTSTDGGLHWSDPLEIGPPGLKEANLPGIDASAPGKIAIAYYGSENSPGAPFAGSYTGVTWNSYITMTTDALSADPVLFTGTVNAKSDPIERGQCGPGRCGNVWDFLDVIIAPDGTPWSSSVDACTAGCVAGGAGDVGADGIAGHLVGGPSLA